MLAYAIEAIELVGARSGNELSGDRMRFLAVSRTVEIIGEAAARVSQDVKVALPAIPFRNAISMRNRLIHGYGSTDAEILADTVKRDLPKLVKTLRAALAGILPDEMR